MKLETQPLFGSLECLPLPKTYNDPDTAAIVYERDSLGRDIGTALAASAARRSGADITWLNRTYALAQQGTKQMLFAGVRCRASKAAASIVRDKWLAKQLLTRRGIKTSRGILPQNIIDVLRFQKEIDGPIVVKPRFGWGGDAVSVDLVNSKDIRWAYKDARRHGDVIVEEHIHHESEFRCMASAEECISVVGRLLPWVQGDGNSTVRSLIVKKNQVRETIPSTHHRPIPIDALTDSCLRGQSVSLDTVLDRGQSLIVRRVGGLSSGGEPYECFDLIDPNLLDFAVAAVRAIPGLNWAGLDIVITPGGEPSIVEINTSADICGSRFPWYGGPKRIEDFMYKLRLDATLPMKTTTPRFPPLTSTPKQLHFRDGAPLDKRYRLAALLRHHLASLGWSLDKKSDTIALATSPDGKETWLQGTSTTQDLNIARRAAERHEVVRRLFTHAGLSCPPAKKVRARSQIEHFRRTHGSDVDLIGPDLAWAGTKSLHLEATEEPQDIDFSENKAWTIQSAPAGKQYTAIASTKELLVLLGDHMLDYNEYAPLSALAVRAIRAVPELRWGAVDMVLPDGSDGREQLVLGIQLNPILAPNDRLLAGSLGDVLDYVVL